MHSSVISEQSSHGRNGRRVNSSAELSSAAMRGARESDAAGNSAANRAGGLATGGGRAKFIDGPEIQITRHQDLNAIAVVLGDGWGDVDRALQDLGQHIA